MADEFEAACDHLSTAVDSVQFERIRWARTEGPMLEALVGLARDALASRSEFELTEEGTSGACRRFVLKVHSFRIAAINIALEGQTVAVWGEAIDRGRARMPHSQRHTAEYAAVDEEWIKRALGAVFGEIQPDGRAANNPVA
jgi:hypothetical protein